VLVDFENIELQCRLECARGSVVKLSRVLRADEPVLPERHVLFDAIEPIPSKPELSAPRLDEKTQATAIGEFVVLVLQLCSRFP